MSELLAFSRMSLLLVWVLLLSAMTSGFPQPRLPLRSSDDPQGDKLDDWEVLFPSISLHDWNLQMMSAPGLRAAASDSKAGLMGEAWLFAPERTEASLQRFRELSRTWRITQFNDGDVNSPCCRSVEGVWPNEWASEGARLVKRNMVVADDAAFREKSKLLTSMERQKWLNSYMQKLLVVNS